MSSFMLICAVYSTVSTFFLCKLVLHLLTKVSINHSESFTKSRIQRIVMLVNMYIVCSITHEHTTNFRILFLLTLFGPQVHVLTKKGFKGEFLGHTTHQETSLEKKNKTL